DRHQRVVMTQSRHLGVLAMGVQQPRIGPGATGTHAHGMDLHAVVLVAAADDGGAVLAQQQARVVGRSQQNRRFGVGLRGAVERLAPPPAVLVAGGVIEPPDPLTGRVDRGLGGAAGPVGGPYQPARRRRPGMHLLHAVGTGDQHGPVGGSLRPLRQLDPWGAEPALPVRRRPVAHCWRRMRTIRVTMVPITTRAMSTKSAISPADVPSSESPESAAPSSEPLASALEVVPDGASSVGVEVAVSLCSPVGEGLSVPVAEPPPTACSVRVKVNSPLMGWPSAETTRQSTEYSPADRSSARGRETSGPSMVVSSPVASSPSGPVMTMSLPRSVMSSLKVSTTASGTSSSSAPSSGVWESSVECAEAGSAPTTDSNSVANRARPRSAK